MKRKHSGWLWAGAGLLWLLSGTLCVCTAWYCRQYKLTFRELIYTMTTPLKGTGLGIISEVLRQCVPKSLLVFLIFLLPAVLVSCRFVKRRAKDHPLIERIRKMIRRILLIAPPVFAVCACVYTWNAMNIGDYVTACLQTTTIYEDYYADPSSVELTAPEEKKNLLCIYLESMETTYADEAEGGKMAVNLMPGMTELANTHLTFTDKVKGKLGGYHCIAGTNWTIASMLASTAGVAFSFPVDGNSMNRYESFAPGLITLGDLLEDEGYAQEFLCGSDASYAGRSAYLTQHGNTEIFDLFTAREKGYIAEDYYVWWGFEDRVLYRIAKDELTRLASADQPFHLTMLTIDPHHLNGYVCEECGDDYDDPTANVIACADRQLTAFLAWCAEQPWYEDTVIVILGDHPRMDVALVDGIDYSERTAYNCILNSVKDADESRTVNRVYTPMDYFPTTLSALGWTIEGNRLGLGTDLFSETETLAEEKGLDWIDTECGKSSPGFVRMFCAAE